VRAWLNAEGKVLTEVSKGWTLKESKKYPNQPQFEAAYYVQAPITHEIQKLWSDTYF